MDDLISRKLVIDSFKFDDDGTLWSMDEIVYRLEQFPSVDEAPSAQPETAKRTAESEQNVSEGDLISRKLAIESLSYCQTYLFDSRDKDKKISLENAEDTIKQLPSVQPEDKCGECDAWNKYKNYPPSAQPEQRWIPAWQEYPQDNRFVLVCNDDGRMAVAQYIGREVDPYHPWQIAYCPYDVDVWDDNEHGKIVAWMDLPKPYREGGDDERGSLSTFERLRSRILSGEQRANTAAQFRPEQGDN